ncbi:RAQPRD family integrative conjugative element protein [Pseudomonas bharatica]|uniref:integrative conjugative element protein, RAQPRD family n=1 Tax=Pseudomonas bharatica TaxID=2692112 RepID=UPI003B28864D
MKHILYSLLAAFMITLGAAAQVRSERSDLALVQRQIAVIEQLVERARGSHIDTEGSYYHFDYPRFATDLARVRQGINNYLSPSRAQPADLVDLTDDYRAEAPLASSPNEHD